jgi:N-acetyltransferase
MGTEPRFVEPLTLKGRHALIEPLGREHEAGIRAAAADGELWRLWYTSVPSPENTLAWFDTALAMRDKQGAMPFVIRDAAGNVVGSTRYFAVEPTHRRLEIGYTWYAKRVQRTAVNTECKLMLLTHAFEVLDCIAVEFRTSFLNFQSREAIARLGAKQDGILRNHQILPNGTLRDTVVFSIIASEWPTVKRHLAFKLEERLR